MLFYYIFYFPMEEPILFYYIFYFPMEEPIQP